ncbi:MAG: hypothetical protein CL798_09220 [Chromatiales bacterium]|nr:hypothetical protein [Chromatiales bacterium]
MTHDDYRGMTQYTPKMKNYYRMKNSAKRYSNSRASTATNAVRQITRTSQLLTLDLILKHSVILAAMPEVAPNR